MPQSEQGVALDRCVALSLDPAITHSATTQHIESECAVLSRERDRKPTQPSAGLEDPIEDGEVHVAVADMLEELMSTDPSLDLEGILLGSCIVICIHLLHL